MTSEIKNPISVVIVGHVDHGKSTFIGRFLYDTDNLAPEKLEELKSQAKESGKKLEFAHVMDQFREEREQNITIDTAQTFFQLENQPYVFVDAPGHKEYLKNMITGATQASTALLLLDVNEGIREQTKKHVQILNLLHIDHLAVLVNKMDSVQFDQQKFNQVKTDIESTLKDLGLSSDAIIPISAYEGDNVVNKSKRMNWYTGSCVVDFVMMLNPQDEQKEDGEVQFPVQLIYDLKGDSLVLGRLEKGVLSKGDTLKVFPGQEEVKVKKIVKFQESIKKAQSGESIGLILDSLKNIKRGSVLIGKNQPVQSGSSIVTETFWASPDNLSVHDQITIECRTQKADAAIVKIWDEFGQAEQTHLEPGGLGMVEVNIKEPLFVEIDEKGKVFSRLVYHKGKDVAGCGVVQKILAGLVILFVCPDSGWAYIDPGSGFAIASGIGAWIVGLFALFFGLISLTFKKWVVFFKKLFSRKK